MLQELIEQGLHKVIFDIDGKRYSNRRKILERVG